MFKKKKNQNTTWKFTATKIILFFFWRLPFPPKKYSLWKISLWRKYPWCLPPPPENTLPPWKIRLSIFQNFIWAFFVGVRNIDSCVLYATHSTLCCTKLENEPVSLFFSFWLAWDKQQNRWEIYYLGYIVLENLEIFE